MPRIRKLSLTSEQRTELVRVRDKAAEPYMRERAGALLKIADGAVPSQVAAHGLLKPRDPDTVYSWMNEYEAKGIDGLRIKQGRGRKPRFSP